MRAYDNLVESVAKSRVGGWLFVHVFTHLDRFLIKSSRGRLSTGIGSRFHNNALVLSTTGARSGKQRDVAVLFARHGDAYVVIASAAGQAKNPAWYYNLKAHPEATVHADGKVIQVVAREAEGDERAHLFAEAVATYAGFTAYQRRTSRTIPVMLLEPR